LKGETPSLGDRRAGSRVALPMIAAGFVGILGFSARLTGGGIARPAGTEDCFRALPLVWPIGSKLETAMVVSMGPPSGCCKDLELS